MIFINIIAFLLYFLLGITLSEIITGRPKGPTSSLTEYPNQRFPSLFIGFGVSKIESVYHIHHWMYGLALSIISLLSSQLEIAGLFLGITLQGLSYQDRFQIKVPLEKISLK